MKSAVVRRGGIMALFVLCSVPSAHAQLNSYGPAFSHLSGGLIWGSLGFRDLAHPTRLVLSDHHPAVRGGFAAVYGPFGGQPDTTVALDSVRTSVEWISVDAVSPGATRVDTVRTVRAIHSRHTIPGRDGWVSLAVGYEYSSSYEVKLSGREGNLHSTFPVGGFYAAAFFGPFPVWHAPRPMFWYTGVGATLAQLSDANGISDSTLVRFNTERTLGPEAQVVIGWRVYRGVRALAGMSVQHIRWSAIRYRAPSELPLPDAVLRGLPDGLRLTSVHLSLGVSFDASDLFAK